MFLLYNIVYFLILVFYFPYEYMRRPSGLRSVWLREKLGRPSVGTNGGSKGRTIWVHAVSVGEASAAATFIHGYREVHPDIDFVVSTITDTGRAVAEERLAGSARVIYLPFDLPGPLSRAFSVIRPDAFLVMETELWPNMIRVMRSNSIPVAVINGRVSERSFRGYMSIRWMFRPVLGFVDTFCMQDSAYAERILSLGVDSKNVIITGSFKFDIKVKYEEKVWAEALPGPVVVAGSTHRGEEDLVIRAFKGLSREYEDLFMIIAPRHPHRFDEVWEALGREGLKRYRRSDLGDPGLLRGGVMLLDTIGELSSLYRAADLAVIGGSFIPHGGQNPLEPAFWGKPAICGPYMENFPFIREFYEKGAALECSEEALESCMDSLLRSEERRLEIGGRARDILEMNRGAVHKTIEMVEGLLER